MEFGETGAEVERILKIRGSCDMGRVFWMVVGGF
jgi:hypothetical protein